MTRKNRTAVAAGLCALVSLAVGTATRAADGPANLPEDTNQIERLTPEQARKLAREFPGVEVEVELKGSGKSPTPGCLPLNRLKSLDKETAQELAGYGKGPILLRGLTTLDAETAGVLAGLPMCCGPVEADGLRARAGLTTWDGQLPRLTTLDADTARALAGFEGRYLDLSGLTTLDADTARAFAGFKGMLILSGLKTLDAATAEAFAGFNDGKVHLDPDAVRKCLARHPLSSQTVLLHAALLDGQLDGLTTLDAVTARALAGFKGNDLRLPGLTTLDAETARALAGFRGRWLSFSGLTTLDAATAGALAGFTAWDGELDRLTVLDADTARALAACRNHNLFLSGLTTLDAGTARALAGFQGKQLLLNGLETLDADTARALAEFNGDRLELRDLKTLDAVTARALAGFKGTEMFLDDLQTLDTATALALAGFQGRSLNLSRLKTLDADTARAFAGFKGMLILSGLKTFDYDTAEVLAGCNGRIHVDPRAKQAFLDQHPLTSKTALLHAGLLDGSLHVTTLDAATARALAGFKGETLDLFPLTTLDVETARALEEFKGDQLWLRGVRERPTLDADTALALAVLTKWDGQLSGLTAFESPDSVAIAKALAARKGPLSLPKLKRISPKTLAALLQKTDVEIPLVETLELIPEPDGSPTDDIVVPDRFQQR